MERSGRPSRAEPDDGEGPAKNHGVPVSLGSCSGAGGGKAGRRLTPQEAIQRLRDTGGDASKQEAGIPGEEDRKQELIAKPRSTEFKNSAQHSRP